MRLFLATLFLMLTGNCAHASLPYFPVSFPRDEGAHYKNVPYTFNRLLEWWYFNGKFTTDDGRSFSYDVAMFNPAFEMGNINTKPFLHIQISDLDNKKSYGFAGEYPLNSGTFSTDDLSIKLGNNYQLSKRTTHAKDIYALQVEGIDGDTAIKLNLQLERISPHFLINDNGLMPMMNDTNSYYYTIPHFKTTGEIAINQTRYTISKSGGDSWMDHQWGDFNVNENGWEWFSVRLKNGLVANIFLFIEYKNNSVVGGLANVILPSGEKRFIPYNEFTVTRSDYWLDQKLGIAYPMTFTISFPSLGLSLKNQAAFPEQELHGYWEGYCNVSAVYQNQHVSGYSFTEIVYESSEMKSLRVKDV